MRKWAFGLLVTLLAACGAEALPPQNPSPTAAPSAALPAATTLAPAPSVVATQPPPTDIEDPPASATGSGTLPSSDSPKIESASPGADSLTMREIETVIVAARQKHAACFRRWADQYPNMPTIVRIRITIAESGKVKNAQIQEPAAGEAKVPPEVAQCHLGVARTLTFRKTPAPVIVAYPARFVSAPPAPEDEGQPLIERPSGLSPDSPTESHALEPSQVLAVVVPVRPKLRRCYATALQRNPTLVANLRLRIVVAPSGKVQSVTFIDPAPLPATQDDPALRQCVASHIKTLVFPPSAQGATFILPLAYHP